MATSQQTQAPVPKTPNRTLIERMFLGLDLSSGPMAMADGSAQQNENLMPYENGHNTIFPGPLLLIAAPAGKTISFQWAFVIGSTPYIIAQMSDGSVYATPTSAPAWTLLTAAGTTTVNGLHMTKWQATDANGKPEAVLWVDTANGYGSWDGTSWTQLETQNGQAIAVYAGRVWIADDQTVIYSAPDTYDDFLTADYAGSFKITDTSMSGPIYGLYGTQNWLYIIGSGMMALNNVQVANVGGSTTLETTFFITPVSASIGITTDRAAMVYDNYLLLLTSSGLWAWFGLNGQILSTRMGDNFNGSQFVFAGQVYGVDLLASTSGYWYAPKLKKWFSTITDSQAWTCVTTLVWEGTSAWSTDGNNVYQLGADMATARTGKFNSKLYDAGNAAINKRITKMGCELYQDQLQAAPPSGTMSVTIQVKGWLSDSISHTVNGLDITKNQWVRRDVNLTDRYLSIYIEITAKPSVSIGSFLFQFQESTPWP